MKRFVVIGIGIAVLAICAKINAAEPAAHVTVQPAPREEKLSDDFEVTVSGQEVPVYSCRVSAMPFNQVWPGYQRPLDQTELASFAYWDMAKPVQVVVVSHRPVRSVALRPSSLGIRPQVEGNRISFNLERPCPVVLEVNGWHHALHLFASPPEKDAPKPGDANVRYFGPGVHRPGRIALKSNEQVYIAAGAVVHGSVHAQSASNIAIRGRGILDVSSYERGKGGGAIALSDCSNIRIEGIVMRDPDVWCCSLFGCRNAVIENVKLVGLWRYNADGIDICNSQDVVIRDSFVRSFDDSLVLKGLAGAFKDRPVRNVRASGCVLWNDWGRAMELGAETCAPSISEVLFEDCDIIRTTHIAMDIQHGDRAAVSKICFRNIRVEIDDQDQNPPPRMQSSRDEKYRTSEQDKYCPELLVIVIRGTPYSQDKVRGTVRDVLFKDISVLGRPVPTSQILGFDAEHDVQRVAIENLRFDGRPIANAAEARLSIHPHVKDVKFSTAR